MMNGTSAANKTKAVKRPVSRRDFIAPLVIIFGLTILVLTAGVHFAVRTFDKGSETREQVLARQGIAQRINEVALLVVPQTDWDDAVRKLDNTFDPSFSRTNIGSFLNQTDGFDRSFVLGSDDRLREGYIDGKLAPPTAYAPIAALAGGLIRDVRGQEERRGAFTVTQHERMISRPIQASALKLVDGHLAVMTATLVQPDFGHALPSTRAPIVVTTMPVNPAFLSLFSKRYLLKDLRLVPPNAKPLAEETAIPVSDENGRTLALLAWKPLNPGYSMLRDLLPPMLAVCLVLVAVAFVQLRRIAQLAKTLIEGQGYWHDKASHDALTDLPNRFRFQEQIAFEIRCIAEDDHPVTVQCVRVAPPIGLAQDLIDQVAEEIVQITAQRLTRICRQEAIVARLADDRFGILSVGASERDAEALARRILSALSAPYATEQGAVVIEGHVGSVTLTDAAADAACAIHEAEFQASVPMPPSPAVATAA